MNALAGKKTYIIAGLVALVAIAQNLGYLTADQTALIYGLLGGAGLGTLRAGVG